MYIWCSLQKMYKKYAHVARKIMRYIHWLFFRPSLEALPLFFMDWHHKKGLPSEKPLLDGYFVLLASKVDGKEKI